MEKINNINASYYVKNRIDFKGSNLKGYNCNITKSYIVKSYNIIILIYKDKIWIKNIEKYSKSTTQHMNQCDILTNETVNNEEDILNFLENKK